MRGTSQSDQCIPENVTQFVQGRAGETGREDVGDLLLKMFKAFSSECLPTRLTLVPANTKGTCLKRSLANHPDPDVGIQTS